MPSRLATSLFLLLTAAWLTAAVPAPWSIFNNNLIFQPPSYYQSHRTVYARTLQLPDNSFLVTWEDGAPEPPLISFPVYRSIDGGATWSKYSSIQDTKNGWGMRYQPFLYLLDVPFGGYPAGTILAAGNSVPANLNQSWVDLYASTDNGRNWEFVSNIAKGGRAVASNGNPAIWEPFLMMYNNMLVCYYSDQRDPKHGQKLVHQTTTDLHNWSAAVDDVAYPTYTDRPGMSVVAHIKSTNKYILTYEYGGGPVGGEVSSSYRYPVFYKVAENPLEFNKVEGKPVITADSSRTVPDASPYVIWTPRPGATDGSGIIIMNAGSSGDLYINNDGAGENSWSIVRTTEAGGHSRSLRIIRSPGKEKLLISGAGYFGQVDTNKVTCGVIDISTRLGNN
ncbi:glycoside hydrolase family 93 protein [Zopfia rhizophila CBS 207.26]|uniref:Glycoside hydrolase family 93 protein n=1 Tax=Zopfia rhizophila CBS 207.26 TaxID=1314779 RepID=A0A6A6E346_9PEZI|nr:glycoside hydrolase family 93 protein [Zopfia rhizophila CBS 207.26]